MKAIQIISQDLFDKIRSRFSNLEMGDKAGSVTIDPVEARFFDFDFMIEGNDLGRISISINDPGSLKIYYSQGITEDQDADVLNLWYSFLKEMRHFAKRRLLRFDTRDIAKNNLDQRDFQHLAATKTDNNEEQKMVKMSESKWNGRVSSKTSRRVQGKTEVIVRHRKPVSETFPGDRSRGSNISAIFIQNRDGERFKSPFNYLPLAFALAQHIDHGGVPYDEPAKKIISMCEEIAQLQEFRKHVQSPTLNQEALGITERAVGRLNHLKATLESLGKSRHYKAWLAEFNEGNGEDLIELDTVAMEEYKSKFTETRFKEELTKFFPLIHRIMAEEETVDLEDYATQSKENEENEENIKENIFNEFEQWAESIEQHEQEDLTDDQIANLTKAIQDLTDSNQPLELGPDGMTAWDFFSQAIEIGQGGPEWDSSLKNDFEAAANSSDDNQSADPLKIFSLWAEINLPDLVDPDQNSELATVLGLKQPEEPEQPQQPTGAQPAPQPEIPAQPQPNVAPPVQEPTPPMAEDIQEMLDILKLSGAKTSYHNYNPK